MNTARYFGNSKNVFKAPVHIQWCPTNQHDAEKVGVDTNPVEFRGSFESAVKLDLDLDPEGLP